MERSAGGIWFKVEGFGEADAFPSGDAAIFRVDCLAIRETELFPANYEGSSGYLI
ncbi:hypothetical protein J2X72_004138 [Phyllobacterium sp. 1468]|uniref:hypothetical protein n=1 Tax=Phyllobacterium sp. 1468 TaxID=2817759 RepID=UPI00285C3FDA|nr:hypothetical protein [Phyllobacterium sp. 1468]MDR6635324.1 hypothetical protein [Phyllobacterium sp. 1468]